MNVKIKGLWEKIRDFFLNMNKKVRLLIGGVLIAVLLVVVVAVVISFTRPYTVLFTGLSGEEARAIAAYLDDNGVTSYRLEGGDTIKVPANMEANLKAKLLMEGYPKSGFAYETYRSAVGTMSTESDRTIAALQDLQDRMAATIRYLDGVQNAVVTIAPEEDRRYILDSGNMTQASASVMVTMRSGIGLSAQQADAIRNLVSHAVQGLEIGNVVISDSLGNVYNPGDVTAATGDASLLKLQLEEQVNNSVRTQVMQVLTPLFGSDNVRVAVYSTVDVSHIVGESTTYTEPTWATDGSTGGEGIIGKKIYDQEVMRNPDGTVGGVVGTETNSDLNAYVENNITANGDESYIRNQGEVDYNVNSAKTQEERWAGTVSDVMVSVTINSEANAEANTNNLLGHVARAAGIDATLQADKISIYVGPFYQTASAGILPGASDLPFPAWMLYAAIGGLALLLILLVVFGLLRKKKKNKKRTRELSAMLDETLDLASAQGMASGADIMSIKTERSMELRKDIRQFAEDSPEIAAYMLKSWLRGGEEQGG